MARYFVLFFKLSLEVLLLVFTLSSLTDGTINEKECVDNSIHCLYWAGVGECKVNPRYMHTNCKYSCGVCGNYVCQDRHENCPVWAENGECGRNPFYMLAHCHVSCQVCINDTNECASYPCQNNGTCVDGVNSFKCNCTEMYEGTYCEQNIFGTQPSDAYVLAGHDHTLSCSSQNPTLAVLWLKGGSPLVFNNRTFKLRGRLILRNVIESDTGVYKCIASDIRGNQIASISAQVTVLLHGLNGLECGTVTSPEVLNSTDTRSSSGRIVGGQDALRGSAPWMARLYVRGRGHLCGGSLIDRQWVVTAAHCFHGENPPAREDLSIRLGDHGDLDIEQSEMLIQVEEIYEHEEYDARTFDNDIALIKLVNPIRTYNDYIRPICLANRTKDRDLMTQGALGRVNGWGRIAEMGITAEYLTEVYIPLVSFTTCKRHFRQNYLTFTRNMFCAGYSRGGLDACQGDSGGPYSMTDDTGRWYLTGLVSWGEGCGRTGQYGVYTRYSKYHVWIQEIINMS